LKHSAELVAAARRSFLGLLFGLEKKHTRQQEQEPNIRYWYYSSKIEVRGI
jgi:hypothetical protein